MQCVSVARWMCEYSQALPKYLHETWKCFIFHQTTYCFESFGFLKRFAGIFHIFSGAFNSYSICGVYCKFLLENMQFYYYLFFISILTCAIKSILSWLLKLDGFQVIWSQFVISLYGVFSYCSYVFSAGWGTWAVLLAGCISAPRAHKSFIHIHIMHRSVYSAMSSSKIPQNKVLNITIKL